MSSNIDLLFNKLNGRYFNNFISKRNKIMSEEDLRVAFSSLIDFICNENNIEIPEEKLKEKVNEPKKEFVPEKQPAPEKKAYDLMPPGSHRSVCSFLCRAL